MEENAIYLLLFRMIRIILLVPGFIYIFKRYMVGSRTDEAFGDKTLFQVWRGYELKSINWLLIACLGIPLFDAVFTNLYLRAYGKNGDIAVSILLALMPGDVVGVGYETALLAAAMAAVGVSVFYGTKATSTMKVATKK